MKISQAQKEQNRQKIIAAAVEIITAQGFKAATMRAIARQAEVADATIYNYFPTKEAILFGYYHDHMETLMERLKAIEDFNTYTLQEQLQTLLETSLQLYLADREFVAASYKTVFFSFSGAYRHLKPIRKLYTDMVRDIFEAAIAAGEIPEQVFLDISQQFSWDYYIAMLHYWLKDTSDQFTDTSVLMDKSLDLICSMIKAGVANKVFDILTYLFKQHVLTGFSFIKDRVDTAQTIKRRFMERIDAE